jgi:hypothetical protein
MPGQALAFFIQIRQHGEALAHAGFPFSADVAGLRHEAMRFARDKPAAV